MNWYYSKNGQQSGPVAFTEIQRLHQAGEISSEDLVWQEGTPSWVKLGTLLPPATFTPPASIVPAAGQPPVITILPPSLPDYGDLLCWGILGVLVPCLGIAVLIALIVMHAIEHSAARKAVAAGQAQASEYTNVHPALYIIGLFCCGVIFYPLFMHWRNKSGLFKQQPYAVMVAIIAMVLSIGVSVGLNLAQVALQASQVHPH